MTRKRYEGFVVLLLGSWLIVVGLVTLIRASIPYRVEIPGALAVAVGVLLLRAR